MPQQKPTVFIGSSSEESPVLTTVARLLKRYAKVTPWTSGDEYKRVGDFFLESLLRAPERFDFAVLIFGPDDLVESREQVYFAPRDNVVFELGLFLSKLGRDHTFIIAPRLWQSGIKILSDLQGLVPAEYDPPEREEDLEQRLKKVCKDIGEKILQLGPMQATKGPKGVTEVPQHIENLLTVARLRKAPSRVRNIALDMEVTWPTIREKILRRVQPKEFRDITWQSLMIDSQDERILHHSSETVSASRAQAVERSVLEFCEENQEALEERNVKFECRAYSTLPTIHGFMFNDEVLYFSLCGMKKDKLFGAPNPYVEMSTSWERPSDTTVHFLDAFNDWFEYHWEHGRRIWPR